MQTVAAITSLFLGIAAVVTSLPTAIPAGGWIDRAHCAMTHDSNACTNVMNKNSAKYISSGYTDATADRRYGNASARLQMNTGANNISQGG